jgi:hypothetical protein
VVLGTLLADPAVIRLNKIISSPNSLTLIVEAAQKQALCPSCGEQSGRIGKCPTKSASLALKHEHLPPIMSIGMKMAGKSALYLASSINIL